MMSDLATLLTMLRINPDPNSGKFALRVAIRHPLIPSAAPLSNFRVRDGRLFDGFNREWSQAEFEAALSAAGLLPVQRQADGLHCIQCGNDLAPPQTRFCSRECANDWKRQAMRRKRGTTGHVCVCAVCGKISKVGRPRTPTSR